MPPILKRILANGLLTSGALALIGFAYAELASVFLLARTPTRGPLEGPVSSVRSEDPVASQLRYRVPTMMALWGFLFVAVGEGGLAIWRRRRSSAAPTSAAETNPDSVEELLEQIMSQVEAAKSVSVEPAAAPSPSHPPAENNPVAG